MLHDEESPSDARCQHGVQPLAVLHVTTAGQDSVFLETRSIPVSDGFQGRRDVVGGDDVWLNQPAQDDDGVRTRQRYTDGFGRFSEDSPVVTCGWRPWQALDTYGHRWGVLL
jgi:hypothetical protein